MKVAAASVAVPDEKTSFSRKFALVKSGSCS